MIASPGDVAAERLVARHVIEEWNAVHSYERRTVLLPVAWETHASPAMGTRAQEIINRQILRDSDLLVAIFWTRLGTPTGSSASGTAEEIEEHLRAGKPAMLYFSSAPIRLDSVDEGQYRALREFKHSYEARGLVEQYESITEFREKFWRQLTQTVIRGLPTQMVMSERREIFTGSGTAKTMGENSGFLIGLGAGPTDGVAALSNDANQLLIEASTDPHGTVLATTTMSGLSVQSNGRAFVEAGDPRSEARWRGVIQELVRNRLLEQRDHNGEVFSVTDIGYVLADRVTRR